MRLGRGFNHQVQHRLRSVVDLHRRFEVESFPWSLVELTSDGAALGLCQVPQAGSFGSVLADEAIEVFVAAPLPGMVGGGEVAGKLEALFEQGVVVELGAIVEGDGFELVGLPGDDPGEGPGNLVLGSGAELSDEGVAALALDECQQAVLGALADDGVGFPVSEPEAFVGRGRAFGDMSFSRQNAAGSGAAVVFAADLGQDAGVGGELAVVVLVAPQKAIDGFVGGHGLALQTQGASDLDRAPAPSNQGHDASHDMAVVVGHAMGFAAPGDSPLVGLVEPV